MATINSEIIRCLKRIRELMGEYAAVEFDGCEITKVDLNKKLIHSGDGISISFAVNDFDTPEEVKEVFVDSIRLLMSDKFELEADDD